jgi:Protein of unknown function (DUF3048) N-terminal domain/Protein of unknown function (DUF3048) C-terminal domain
MRLKPRWELALAALGISVLLGAGVWSVMQHPQTIALIKIPSPKVVATPTPTSTPTPVPLVARALDGVLVPAGQENIRPLAVMIENHTDARPQYGLSSANLVYEAIAEGGITRFMAVFANPAGTNARVEPIRSARTYYLDFATELKALYAHVGGNIDALDQIATKGGVGNLDQFSVGAPTYARDSDRVSNVAIEHTMYSTTGKLWDYAASKDMTSQVPSYKSWNFTDPAPLSQRPKSGSGVSINFSTPSYRASWEYDAQTNLYSRSQAGQPHLDASNNAPITAANIVLQQVAYKHILTRINEQGQVFTLTGSGSGTLLQNGSATPITWKNDGVRTRYYLKDGSEATFVRGTTWVELVHVDTGITFQ